ncbi:MAG: hypothetical protein OK439_00250 [Thaumarchaeota archaeon]|nr:hypothetical protein [Nitrososphaerota archaeon]
MKQRDGVFDELGVEDEYGTGPPVYYPNQNIRRMLSLAQATENDVFCDLGSGFAQNIIIALTEFNVKKAFGFEINRERLHKSRKRLADGHLSGIGEIIGSNMDDGLTENRLRRATIIYYGLSSDSDMTIDLIGKIERTWGKLQPGRKLLYHHKNVIPEIMPDDSDFPFYVSITQPSSSGMARFIRAKSQKEWLSAIVSVPKGMIHRKEPSLKQLWREFTNNFDVEGIIGDVEEDDGIKDRLRKATSK